MENHIKNYFEQVKKIIDKLNLEKIEKLAHSISEIRDNQGRIFFLGVGGSAANCSHAVNDFRKLCSIESYAPTDNVSELTARINDDGWESSLSEWLKISKLNHKDALFIFSVGGGNIKAKVSVNLIKAVDLAKERKSKIFGIIGKEDGYTNDQGDIILVLPETNNKLITPLSESFQAILWHCLVSHPLLQMQSTKW